MRPLRFFFCALFAHPILSLHETTLIVANDIAPQYIQHQQQKNSQKLNNNNKRRLHQYHEGPLRLLFFFTWRLRSVFVLPIEFTHRVQLARPSPTAIQTFFRRVTTWRRTSSSSCPSPNCHTPAEYGASPAKGRPTDEPLRTTRLTPRCFTKARLLSSPGALKATGRPASLAVLS